MLNDQEPAGGCVIMTTNEWYHCFDGAVSMDVIKSIQADSRSGMIEVSELDPVIDLLESVDELAPDFLDDEDGHFSKETKPILDRLKALRNEHTS